MPNAKLFDGLIQFANKRPIVLLLFFFATSIIIRIPNLDRPLSKHHEANNALVLISAQSWNARGAGYFNYVPVNSYNNAGDDYSIELPLIHGTVVNDSFGSLWYVMPYYFFKLICQPPSPFVLQLFNLLLELIVLLLIYKIVCRIFNEHKSKPILALLTCLLYSFAPALLWFHGNAYMHEVAVLPFFFAGLYFMLSFIKQSSNIQFKSLLLFSFVIIAGINCDWIMLFLAFACLILALYQFNKTKDKKYLYWSIWNIVSVLIGLSIVIYQFGSFMGYENYFHSLLSRFEVRSVNGSTEGKGLSSNLSLASFYVLGYGAFLILLLFFLFQWKKLKIIFKANKLLSIATLTTISIVLLHHIVFWGFTNIHDYSVVKAGFPIALLASVVLYYISKNRMIITSILLISILCNIGLYYYINRPGNTSANGTPYTYFKTLGEKIKEVSDTDENIIINIPEVSPLLTYYSKRIYIRRYSLEDAKKVFETLPSKKGIYIDASNLEFKSFTKLRK